MVFSMFQSIWAVLGYLQNRIKTSFRSAGLKREQRLQTSPRPAGPGLECKIRLYYVHLQTQHKKIPSPNFFCTKIKYK